MKKQINQPKNLNPKTQKQERPATKQRGRYKLAVFDMDGTILNTLEDLTDSVNYALEKNSLPLRTIDEVKFFVGNGVRLTVERAVPADTPPSLIDKVYADFKEYYAVHSADKTCAYPGILNTLKVLKQAGIKTACVSNKPDKAVKDLCEQYFKGLFDVAIGENEAAGIKKKPAADEVWLALDKLGISKKDAIYIGDSDVDIATAKNSKLDMCVVTWGFRDKAFLKQKGAVLFADNTDELQDILLSCKYAYKCGGCSYQNVSYEKSLLMKQRRMEELLGKYGRVRSIIGMDQPLYYRNKVHHVFGYDRRNGAYSGFYEEESHEMVKVNHCQIENSEAQEIIKTIEKLLSSFKIKVYDEDTGYGLFRHAYIRTGHNSGEILVVLVVTSPIFPSKNNFVRALRKEHPSISSVVLNINDRQTSMVLGERNITLAGKGYIEDTLCGKTFRISPNSFYQVNSVQTEVLYSTAMQLAKIKKSDIVLDAYCGIGTIGMIAAEYAKHVIGVELNKSAVRDAYAGAKSNHVNNISFVCDDAGDYIEKLVSNYEEKTQIDLVIMDPPRSGSTEKFLSSVNKLSPKRIVYISCGPETLARDLEYLTSGKYRVETIQPVDLFPFTSHVETVCLLSKKP